MYYKIVHEQPCRMRVRCGKQVFDNDEMRGITLYLLQVEGVKNAVVRPANGSILIEYETQARTCVIDALDSLDIMNLPKTTEDAKADTVAIDNDFYLDLSKTIASRYIRKLILPPIIRHIWLTLRLTKYIYKAIKCLMHGHLGVEVLDATALSVAVLAKDFKTASSVMFLLKISDLLSDYTEARTHSAMRENMSICAETVWIIRDNLEIETPIEDVQVGDLIRVRMGCLVPMDGIVEDGVAEVNEASMTGESSLVRKSKGSTVYASTVVDEGSLLIKTTALAGQSRIDHIVNMVENSQSLKASAQSEAERLAESMVPVSLGVFALELIITKNLTHAMSVLMVDYSCAIKLAAPVAVMSAMREATRRKAVVKGGKYLEALANADAIIFDKTGTLTKARPEVEKILVFGDKSEEELLKVSACLEEHFPHSMARAIVRTASERELNHCNEMHADVEYIVSHGIASKIDGKRVCIGSAHFIFDDEHAERPLDLDRRLKEEAECYSTVFLSIEGKLEGVLCITDPLRKESKEVIDSLRDCGFEHIVMLTGDSENCASNVARELGITEYQSQVLPEDKALYVKSLKSNGSTVVMVGDGINDSPALAAADVSVALSDASDIARSVADIAVVDSSLDVLVDMRHLSQQLMERINRSYGFIITFNSALIILGLIGFMQPATAALLHNASTVALTAANTRSLLD